MDAQTAVEFDRMKRRLESIESEHKDLKDKWEKTPSTPTPEHRSEDENQKADGSETSAAETSNVSPSPSTTAEEPNPEAAADGGVLETPVSGNESQAEITNEPPTPEVPVKRRNVWGRSRT